MPEHTITLSEADQALIERVKSMYGFQTLQEAGEWLIKKRLRRSVRQAAGRGRALYLVAQRSNGEKST